MEITYNEIDRDETPLGTLILRRYEAETGDSGFEILLDGNFLMASHGSHSERAMAALAHQRLSVETSCLTALVGGLGAGHTLRATLDLERVERVVVAEIGAKVVEWNKLHFKEVNAHAVDDPRVEVRVADLATVLAENPHAFHLILADVDNGPGWLAADGNARLYTADGLEMFRNALIPGGVLAVWSPGSNLQFVAALELVFAKVEAVDTSEIGRTENEPGSIIYIARL